MTFVPAPRRLEVLDRDECVRLLANDEVGRLAVNEFQLPVMFPVNYRLDGDAIVFRTDAGTKQTRGNWAAASFEIDHFDRAARVGWSVVVKGRLEEVTEVDHDTFERVHALAVDPWGGGDKAHWMRLTPLEITGRRLVAS
ncbi:MAG TPA: pyridoxamine 5'-phosphate oxidase family protein [Acidimicrobiales bacterium]|nr:pyridoxamine 5'-phosphate oxidase family protein [Acidimicrobiales bacterium]